MSTINLFTGDSLEVLKGIADNSIDSIVCDPPYGLSFMAKKWDYDVPSKDLWEQALRVLKPGGHLLAFGGTRTYHRLVVNIEDAGFEIRDQIQWLYGSGFPKSMNIDKVLSKQGLKDEAEKYSGYGTALKPANEPICVARKPLEKGLTVAQNVLKYGTGAINIDESRISTEEIKDATSEGGKFAMWNKEGDNKGFTRHNGNGTSHAQGRWPANIILDEAAAEMLDLQSGVLTSGAMDTVRKESENRAMNGKNYAMRVTSEAPKGGASRFFYVAKASKSERNKGLEGMPLKAAGVMDDDSYVWAKNGDGSERNKKVEPRQNFHPTVKPVKLMEYLIRLVTPKGGTTLDPFMGSGSTGVAAKNLGFNFVGIELNEEYTTIAEKRIGVANELK